MHRDPSNFNFENDTFTFSASGSRCIPIVASEECDHKFRIFVKYDVRGGETSWKLKKGNDDSCVVQGPCSEHHSNSVETYVPFGDEHYYCLEGGEEYTFVLYDSYGDGLASE